MTDHLLPTRRERVRDATRTEIKALARQQMAQTGTASVALNGIARALGMVPSALYRYYPDRDALLTALILDAFASLAETLRAADRGASYDARLLAAAHAYRRWSLANIVDFQLVFGSPIPDYHAPLEQTGPAMHEVFRVFLAIIDASHTAGVLRPVAAFQPTSIAMHPANYYASTYPPAVFYTGLVGWATMHGVVALEVFGHMRYTLADPDAFYEGQMVAYLTTIGLRGSAITQ